MTQFTNGEAEVEPNKRSASARRTCIECGAHDAGPRQLVVAKDGQEC